MVGRCCSVRLLAPRGVVAHRLARMLDSLVRVSRRVGAEGSASVPSEQVLRPAKPLAWRLGQLGEQRSSAMQNRSLTKPTHADQRCALKAQPQDEIKPHQLPPPAPLPPCPFQVLFNSLVKVLFTFRSRYLFAIGLRSIFSLSWCIPAA